MTDTTREEMVQYVRTAHLDKFRDLWEQPVELALLLFDIGSEEERAQELRTVIDLSATSKLEWEITSRIAQRALYQGEQLPPELAQWTADVLAKKRMRPGKGSRTIARDIIFCIAVADLRDRFGLTPTKNSASQGDSACGIVAEASGFSYKTVERAWSLRDT